MDLLNDPTPEPLGRPFLLFVAVLVCLIALSHGIGWAVRHVTVTVNL